MHQIAWSLVVSAQSCSDFATVVAQPIRNRSGHVDARKLSTRMPIAHRECEKVGHVCVLVGGGFPYRGDERVRGTGLLSIIMPTDRLHAELTWQEDWPSSCDSLSSRGLKERGSRPAAIFTSPRY